MPGVREQALARLAERQSQERAMVRTLSRRLDVAHAATESARGALVAAEAKRAEVLLEWAQQPGWTAEAIADHTGLPVAEVNAATKGRRQRGSRRRSGQSDATAVPESDGDAAVTASGR